MHDRAPMKRMLGGLGLGVLVSVFAVGCTADSTNEDATESEGAHTGEASSALVHLPPGTINAAFAAVDQSFRASTRWALASLNGNTGNRQMLADVNGDKKADVVALTPSGLSVFVSDGASYATRIDVPGFVSTRGTYTTGDVNGDGLDDLVGFGDEGVLVARSTGNGFLPAQLVLREFGYNQSWREWVHDRVLADVNHDGRKDIVGFGDAGVYLSLATAAGFETPRFVIADLGSANGWHGNHLRTTADVDGDGLEDIVAFGDAGVWVARSTGQSFAPPAFVVADYGLSQGWTLASTDRQIVDLDNDGILDIVGFGNYGTSYAKGLGGGSFAPVVIVSNHFGNNWMNGTTKWRRVADLNGDGYQDLIFAEEEAIYRILGGPSGFGTPRMVLRDLVRRRPAHVEHRSRFVGDADGDGLPDLIGVSNLDVRVARSTTAAPPPPPADPTGARVVAKSNTQVKIAWDDNATDERSYIVWYGKAGNAESPDMTDDYANAATRVIGKNEIGKWLDPDTEYCFTLQAESVYGLSPRSSRVCTRTLPGNRYGTPLDSGISYVCGAGATCPAGSHPVDYDYAPLCSGDPANENRTLCAKNVETFTTCGGCPSGYAGIGGNVSRYETACILPGQVTRPPFFGNATRCAPLVFTQSIVGTSSVAVTK